MKDYYEILGVEEEASDEEIRARWLELAKRYHPDLGKTKEADEKIKEINEAYEVLKDNSKRFDYDIERNFKKFLIKKAHRPKERGIPIQKIMLSGGILVLFLIVGLILFRLGRGPAPPITEVLHETDKVSEQMTALRTPPVEINSEAQSEGKAPKEIKKEIMPQESAKIVSVSPQRSPQKILPKPKLPVKVEEGVPAKEEPKPVKKLVPQVAMKSGALVRFEKEIPKGVSKEIPKEVAKEIPKEVPKESPKQVDIEVPKEVVREVAKEVPKEVPEEIPKEISKEVEKEVSREVAKEIPKEVPKESPKQVAIEVPKEVVREVAKEVPKEIQKEVPKEIPKEIAKEVPKELPKEVSTVTLHPGEKLTLRTKEERIVSSRPSPLAKEEEVKRFFSKYIDRYTRKDIDGFLSFFSSRAVQNQKDGLKGIRKIYTDFFGQSQELRYRVEGMKIEIFQNVVKVKARFRVDQRLKESREEKVWKGNISWVLVKEDGNLKISSLDYQNDKIP
jgi:curved DNA-binding protein CbpA/ketosteroid isomerase-like protein